MSRADLSTRRLGRAPRGPDMLDLTRFASSKFRSISVKEAFIAASKTPSFASSISGEKQLSQTASNCASPSVVDGLTSVAMARSVSETAELAQEEIQEQGTTEVTTPKQST
ncbi:uncharacterized protein TNCV_2266461 [Trichonephila clavipes]|nr:uncharacterized protein TNCV_2266461 [Trichonephila clavipes]